jgi:spore cortex formation protein SpoVR/YcgB (stage V sporulation)
MKLFVVDDKELDHFYEIASIHDETGYKNIRKSLAENYNRARYIPDIQVFDVDIYGDRTLTLNYTPVNYKDLDANQLDTVLEHVAYLWGFPVKMIEGEDDLDIISEVS